jgi:hypothetical protein
MLPGCPLREEDNRLDLGTSKCLTKALFSSQSMADKGMEGHESYPSIIVQARNFRFACGLVYVADSG